MRKKEAPVPRPVPEQELAAIVEIVRRHADGTALQEIASELPEVPVRTLQYRLQRLVEQGHLVREGERRWTRYRLPSTAERETPTPAAPAEEREGESPAPVSPAGEEIRAYLRQAPAARKPVGYDRAFLDSYRPNESFYLSQDEHAHLAKVGKPDFGAQPAGTYAKQLLNRFLIDLSWNSSRLEGNTYSLLDTRRLIEFGEEAEGRDRLEAQMILNHKDAIEFLVGTAEDIGFNRYTILNLLAILANNLLPDESAARAPRRGRPPLAFPSRANHSLHTSAARGSSLSSARASRHAG